MCTRLRRVAGAWTLAAFSLFIAVSAAGTGQPREATSWLGPAAMALRADGQALYLGCAESRQLLTVALPSGAILRQSHLEGIPTGLALSPDQSELVLTYSERATSIAVVDPRSHRVLRQWGIGCGACAPVVGKVDRSLFICLRFENAVVHIDRRDGRELGRAAVPREPIAAALTPDESHLVVANLLPGNPGATDRAAAAISVLDAASLTVQTNLLLPPGSIAPRSLAMSPDGRYCAVPHGLARFRSPTTQVRHGWVNVNVVSLVDLAVPTITATILLDDAVRGAANPWAAAWSADGESLCITHAGTQELSVIAVGTLMERLAGRGARGVIEDFGFLQGMRRRLPIAAGGPRAMVLDGQIAYVAGYFADTVSKVNLDSGEEMASLELAPWDRSDGRRLGMSLFHDARIGHQGWQSCASCHPDGRADGLNWDLPNDGLGNPKNTKSLVLAHRTPPAMSTGVRGTAEQAVRSGLRNILFSVRPEAEARAIDEYLAGLRAEPSPLLRDGHLSAAAARGKALFETHEVGCNGCHSRPLFSDLRRYAVGTGNRSDRPEQKFDTPTLIECWRTAPYLHDGAASTMRELLTTRNPQDRHGKTSHLRPDQIEDLAAYVHSL